MIFNFINKLIFPLIILFIYSCQDRLKILENENISESQNEYIIEKNDKLDLTFYDNFDEKNIDFYSNHFVNVNFLDKNLTNIKINNYENKFEDMLPVNVIYKNSYIYSVNFKGEILKISPETGKLLERYQIKFPIKNKIPVSFSLIDNHFILGFKSGEIIKINIHGELIWSFTDKKILNTPIKIYNNNLLILFPEDLVILSSVTGKIIFNKNYNSTNIFQSNGGKILTYFNFIYFILPNSQFQSIDTFLYEENITNLNDIKIITPINNLNDSLHIYRNLLVYLDNKNIIHTYDLMENNFILSNLKINNISSSILFNNIFIVKNDQNIEFYNIKNGNLFKKINLEKIFKRDSKIIYALSIKDKLHLFNNDGKLIILNKKLNIENTIDLKIKKINKIYNYQNKIFISTEKGNTYIF